MPKADTFDEVTLLDCKTCQHKTKPMLENATAFILKNHLSPGDVLCMTAAIHSLHRQYPGKYLTAVDTTAPSLFDFNPDVVPAATALEKGATVLPMHYPAINTSNQRGVHMMAAYCEYLSDALKVPVPLLTNRPLLYLSKEEIGWMDQVQEAVGKKTKFWVICAGRKADYTAKFAGTEFYQKVVDLLRGQVFFVQIGQQGHHHPILRNVLNLVGKTDMRQLVRLVSHAQGVLSGVTLAMHLAAALQKPSVIVAGAREPVAWNAYPLQRYLHTVGSLPCCKETACWRSRTIKLGDGKEQDSSLCENPAWGDEAVPQCLALIKPERVAEEILSFSHRSG